MGDLANLYCTAASWTWAARDRAQAQRLVEQAIGCLKQREWPAQPANQSQARPECN